MSRLLFGLLRGTCCAVILACIAAVGLGRTAPRPASFLVFKPGRLEAINGYHFATAQRVPRFFNPETGSFTEVEFPGDDYVDSAAFSTWEDEEGKSEVVARWVKRDSTSGISEGYGLGRYQMPGGELLDRVPMDVMPVGRPCFVPGRKNEVVFSGGDGKLYRLDFEGTSASSSDEDRRGPAAIAWRESTAGKPPLALNDPVWPGDRRMGGRLVVAATAERRTSDGNLIRIGELWWLQLNVDRTEVVAAGRLTRPNLELPMTDGLEEGQPSISVTPDGRLTLAYLRRHLGKSGWSLIVGPIDFEQETGMPIVNKQATVSIAGSRAHTTPIFSHDGRWVYTLRRSDPKPEEFERTALPESLLVPPTRSHVALWRTGPGWN
jgi:hypothetical protein